jgi:glycosyltransferase involved in cell wall biosynthesis
MGRFYSAIIPLYNRPDEIDELLESLTHQTYTHFEVVIIEDGSVNDAREIVERYRNQLQIQYHFKENGGQGFARNVGFELAKGDYFVIFDSDAIIPSQYFEEVENFLETSYVDAFGGPDAAHESFTPIQKAISYSMTSLFTTG